MYGINAELKWANPITADQTEFATFVRRRRRFRTTQRRQPLHQSSALRGLNMKRKQSRVSRATASRRKTGTSKPEVTATLEFDSEFAATLELQRTYAKAVLARGNLPPKILAKYQLMQEMIAKANKRKLTLKAQEKLHRIVVELLPYFHFKVSDNPTEQ